MARLCEANRMAGPRCLRPVPVMDLAESVGATPAERRKPVKPLRRASSVATSSLTAEPSTVTVDTGGINELRAFRIACSRRIALARSSAAGLVCFAIATTVPGLDDALSALKQAETRRCEAADQQSVRVCEPQKTGGRLAHGATAVTTKLEADRGSPRQPASRSGSARPDWPVALATGGYERLSARTRLGGPPAPCQTQQFSRRVPDDRRVAHRLSLHRWKGPQCLI